MGEEGISNYASLPILLYTLLGYSFVYMHTAVCHHDGKVFHPLNKRISSFSDLYDKHY